MGGERGALITAALSTLDDGLVNPQTGQRVDQLPERCSQTLRLLTSKVGVNTGLYFGRDAKETWSLLSRNGQKVLDGRQLSGKDAGALQPGDMLYQDTPANKDGSDYDHIAMYLGNGLVYQHNSAYSSKTGVSKGNINVLTLEEFTKLLPTRAARIPGMAPDSTRTGQAAPAAAPKGQTPRASVAADFVVQKLSAGTFRPNVTAVNGRDLLAVPSGNGTFNLLTDTKAAYSMVYDLHVQATRKFGKEYATRPLSDRKAFLVDLMTSLGYKGRLTDLVNQAMTK